jgi:hypothetical protein
MAKHKEWRKSAYLSSYWNGMQKVEDAGEGLERHLNRIS